ncbi:hypothetical protein [Nonomuraea typhae]|uniref:Allene oxide cyclase barrel-like domain-containing protein n=1 Tax=Nonomuraea typhae TaxID=2603600 RepID=A0ABW7Z866_9ACTN|nr:hypothetical protein [Nonomuraea typhae]
MSNEDYLLAAIRLAAGNDAVPAHVSEAAREAYSLRVPHVVTAATVECVTMRNVRGVPGPHTIRFATDDFAFDLEFTVNDGLIDVAGQILPYPGEGSHVDVRTPHMTMNRRLAGTGQFAVTGMPPGWFNVVCHRPGKPPVATRWLRIRP